MIKKRYIVVTVAFSLFLGLVPFIFSSYFPETVDNLLSYYSSLLSFTGSIFIGCVALYFNLSLQYKNNEISKLQYELDQEKHKHELLMENNRIPFFEISGTSCNQYFLNCIFYIKNVSKEPVHNLQSEKLEILHNNLDDLESYDLQFSRLTLEGGATAIVRLKNFAKTERDKGVIKIEWTFSCENEIGTKFFYCARARFDTMQNAGKQYWAIEVLDNFTRGN